MTAQRAPGGAGGPGGRPRGGGGMFGMGMGMPPSKPTNFRGSLRRLFAQLGPEAPRIGLVVAFAVVSVVLAIVGPKILGDATNIIFQGAISQQLPAGVTQDQVVAGLRAQGQGQLADMMSGMHLTP
ncbi:MAG TPA: hypothetical protein VFI28_06255, partial [Candidatus Limnocylindrales bacterium]|nr:hypothetical protein [Candidatus Limnocylindrales bacterium]